MSVEIEFDPAMDAANIAKHGVPLSFGVLVLEAEIGRVEDRRSDYGEVRIKAYGIVQGQIFVCTFTMPEAVQRLISVHPVREKEAQRWLGGR